MNSVELADLEDHLFDEHEEPSEEDSEVDSEDSEEEEEDAWDRKTYGL